MNAEEARKLTAQNIERQEEITKLIERGEDKIKWACEKGRRRTDIYAGYVEYGIPKYQEVIEHFKNLGYNIKHCYGTNVFDITW